MRPVNTLPAWILIRLGAQLPLAINVVLGMRPMNTFEDKLSEESLVKHSHECEWRQATRKQAKINQEMETWVKCLFHCIMTLGCLYMGRLHRFRYHLGDKEKEQGRERSVKVSFMLVRFMTLWHLAVIVWEWYT